MHYVWTRIALTSAEVDLNTSRLGDLSDEDMAQNIVLWLTRSSKFYEQQTVDVPFKVLLQASERYRHVVESFQWPEYTELVYDEAHALTWAAHNLTDGEQCTFSRLDSDDSFSVDLFEMLDGTIDCDHILVYHTYRQYNTVTGELTRMQHHYAPMFATRYIKHWSPISEEGLVAMNGKGNHENCQLTGVVGNHATYPSHELAVSAHGCFAMQRITGRNVASRFGVIGRDRMEVVPLCDRLDPRFVGYEERIK